MTENLMGFQFRILSPQTLGQRTQFRCTFSCMCGREENHRIRPHIKRREKEECSTNRKQCLVECHVFFLDKEIYRDGRAFCFTRQMSSSQTDVPRGGVFRAAPCARKLLRVNPSLSRFLMDRRRCSKYHVMQTWDSWGTKTTHLRVVPARLIIHPVPSVEQRLAY